MAHRKALKVAYRVLDELDWPPGSIMQMVRVAEQGAPASDLGRRLVAGALTAPAITLE
jgi:hypothetical protein